MRRSPEGWRWWTVVLRGVAAIIFGLFSLFAPAAAFLTLVLLFGVYALVDGVLALALNLSKAAYPRGVTIARGLVSIAAGLVVLLAPGVSAAVLLLVIATWAVVSGALEVAMAIRLRKQLDREWMLGIEGGLSILFGVLLALWPLAGVVVLALWVGAYALVFGGMQIGTGLRLRSYQRSHPPPAAAAA